MSPFLWIPPELDQAFPPSLERGCVQEAQVAFIFPAPAAAHHREPIAPPAGQMRERATPGEGQMDKAPLQATELGACVFFSSIHTGGPEWAHSGPLEGARVGGGGGSVRPVVRFAPDGLCKKESKRVSRRNSMTQHPRDGLRDVGPEKQS